MNSEESALLWSYLEGRMDPQQVADLNDLLRRNPAARRLLLQQTTMETQLREMALAESDATTPLFSPPRRRINHTHLMALAAILVLGAMLLVLSPFSQQKQSEPLAIDGPLSTPVVTADPVAILKAATQVQWQSPTEAKATGTPLTPGWLKIDAGTLQIEFLSGARLLVTGPAALRLDGENAAFLESGTASAYVPEPAHGFLLESPKLLVKDLGTSFGLKVGQGQETEVHCFDGSVELFTDAERRNAQLLLADEALQWRDTKFEKVPVRRAEFPSGKAASLAASVEIEGRKQLWSSYNRQLAAHPSTELLYTFDQENEWSRSVKNRAAKAKPLSNASLVGAAWSSGRWMGKHGLEFRTRGDRLRFTLPGSFEEVTMSAWLRVDSLPNDYNALLLPTHYQRGSVHWNIERGGEMRFTQIRDQFPSIDRAHWNGPISSAGLSSLDLGRWLHLVTTCHTKSGEVVHYRDGVVVGRGRLQDHPPIVFGQMEFGNWGADGKTRDNSWVLHQPTTHRKRHFVGRLDHLLIQSRVASPAEIAEMYRLGQP